MDQALIELLKAALAASGVAVVSLAAKGRAGRRTMIVLALLAALSAGAYVRFGNFHWPRFLHNWDLYHYYVGAKYFPELGYYDLYRCTLVADREGEDRLAGIDEVRDLRTLEHTSAEEALARGPDCHELFTPARWDEFRRDLDFFFAMTPEETWRLILVDKGYNGTPPWTVYAGLLAGWADTTEPWRVVLACALDEVLLVLMLLGVLWAFGPRAFLIATLFLGVNFANRWQHVGGSLLRMDWLASLVLSLCLLKKGRPAASGLLLAHSAAARVFPVLFAAGLAVRAVLFLVKERRLEARALRFGAGLAAGLALFAALGCLGPRGLAAWSEFGENITAHSAAPAGKRIGLKYAILPIGRLDVADDAEPDDNEVMRLLQERWEARRPIALAAAALALCLFVLAVRRLDDDLEAFALGVIPVFFLLSPTRYYWAMLVVPVIVWAALARRWHPDAIAALLLMQTLLFLVNRTGPGSMTLSAISSWCLLIVFAYALWSEAGPSARAALSYLGGRRGEPPD